MKKILLASALVYSMGMMYGCETPQGPDDGSAGGGSGAGQNTGPSTTPANPPGQGNIDPLSDPDNILSERVIYFDFDSANIREEYRAVITAHAEYLADHGSRNIVLQGHADERGSREYNIALGERRAQSVANLLAVQGANQSQMELVSYGEERPEDSASNEAAWDKNRRVEIVYGN